ncbi:hypothetical protein [Elioraea sp.]|uniref:hypothetical protein n=1 Tax=Elioraea sp. TaxID=2185103 RepID=UPI003F6EF064
MGTELNRRNALLAWVALGLALGTSLAVADQAVAARLVWSAAALPVALHVGLAAARALAGGRMGVDVIALAAILGAVALDEAAAAAVVALMVAGGEALEDWAQGRAKRSLTALAARAPRRAARLTDDTVEEIDAAAIRPGEELRSGAVNAGAAFRMRATA